MGTTPGYAGASDVSARTLQLQEALVRVRAGDHRAFGELYDEAGIPHRSMYRGT